MAISPRVCQHSFDDISLEEFLSFSSFISLFLVGIASDLLEFLHRGVFRLREDVLDFCGILQSHGDAYQILKRDKSLLLKSHDIADSHTRLICHFLSCQILLDAPFPEVTCHLLGDLIRIVMEIVFQY